MERIKSIFILPFSAVKLVLLVIRMILVAILFVIRWILLGLTWAGRHKVLILLGVGVAVLIHRESGGQEGVWFLYFIDISLVLLLTYVSLAIGQFAREHMPWAYEIRESWERVKAQAANVKNRAATIVFGKSINTKRDVEFANSGNFNDLE